MCTDLRISHKCPRLHRPRQAIISTEHTHTPLTQHTQSRGYHTHTSPYYCSALPHDTSTLTLTLCGAQARKTCNPTHLSANLQSLVSLHLPIFLCHLHIFPVAFGISIIPSLHCSMIPALAMSYDCNLVNMSIPL